MVLSWREAIDCERSRSTSIAWWFVFHNIKATLAEARERVMILLMASSFVLLSLSESALRQLFRVSFSKTWRRRISLIVLLSFYYFYSTPVDLFVVI